MWKFIAILIYEMSFLIVEAVMDLSITLVMKERMCWLI